MLKIQIDKKFGLKSDENCFILCKLFTDEDAEDGLRWKAERYYRTLAQALEGYKLLSLRGAEGIESWEGVADKVAEIDEKIAEIKEGLGC